MYILSGHFHLAENGDILNWRRQKVVGSLGPDGRLKFLSTDDRASGRLDARPGLDAALKALRRGDTLIVWKLDRLGRDLRHLGSPQEREFLAR